MDLLSNGPVSRFQIALKNLRNFHVYLCSDMLLVVEEREKKGQRRDYLQHVVGLAYAAVIPVAGKPAFQILQPRQDFKYLFRAANSEAKGLNRRRCGVCCRADVCVGASQACGCRRLPIRFSTFARD